MLAIAAQCIVFTCGLFYWRGLTLIPAWTGDHMPSQVWDEITFPLRMDKLIYPIACNGYNYFSYTLICEYRVWWKIDIHAYYSRVKVSFVPICECKKTRWKRCHNASTPRLRDVTDLLWWRDNAKSEKTVPSDNGEIRRAMTVLAELCIQEHKITCKK